nr:proteoglycan 4b [Pseudochaenichthys georgianus]
MSSTVLCAVTLLACALTFGAAQTSCKGRCGAEYYRGNMCQCDYGCLEYEECCTDYKSQCTTKNSCKGRCGERFKRGSLCSCDSDCIKFKQCCPDRNLHCDADEPTLNDASDPSTFSEENHADASDASTAGTTTGVSSQPPPTTAPQSDSSPTADTQELQTEGQAEVQTEDDIILGETTVAYPEDPEVTTLSTASYTPVASGSTGPPQSSTTVLEDSQGTTISSVALDLTPITEATPSNPGPDDAESTDSVPTDPTSSLADPDSTSVSPEEPGDLPELDTLTTQTPLFTESVQDDTTNEDAAGVTTPDPLNVTPYPTDDLPNVTPDPTADLPNATPDPNVDLPNATRDPNADLPNATLDPNADLPNATLDPNADLPNSTPDPTADQLNVTPDPTADQLNVTPDPLDPNADLPNSTPDPTADQLNVTPDPTADQLNVTPDPNADLPNATPDPNVDLPNATPDPNADLPNATLDPNADLPNSTPDPTADQLNVTPDPTADQLNVTPDPNADLPNATLDPTADLPNATPDPTADLPNATPDPTADLPNATPDPTADQLDITPDPTKNTPLEATPKPQDKPAPNKPSQTKPTSPKPSSNSETKPLIPTQTLTIDNPKDYQADDTNDTNLCSGRPVGAVTTLRNGTMVVFRGHYFWLVDRYMVPSPAQSITQVWGVPSPIDTAFTRCNCQGKTYIFKGPRYWRFENGLLDPHYPKVVQVGFDGLRGQITAALSVPQYQSRRESVYFFKRGGAVQKYSYQLGASPTCGSKVHNAVYTVRSRVVRRAVSLLGPSINIRKSWRGFPSAITAAVSVPSRTEREGYKYHVFSRSTSYNVRMGGERPVVPAPTANESPQSRDFFKCQKKV